MAAPTINAGHQTWSDTSNTSSTTAPIPTTLGVDDRWISAIVSDPASQTFTPPDGNWTEEWNDITAQSAFSYYLAYRTGGSAAAAFGLGTAERCAGISFGVTGAGSGFDAKGTDLTGSSSTAQIPAITTVANDCLVVGIVYTDVSSGDTAPTTPSGWTLVASKYQASGGLVAMYERVQATAGTISATNVTLALSEQWAGIVFSLPPVAGGTQHDLTASIAIASNTPDAAITVTRAITASAVAASNTPDAALNVTRSITGNAGITSTTPNATLAIGRNLTSAVFVASNTPNAALNVTRALVANVVVASLTHDASFLGDVLLEASISIVSNTPNAALNVGRSLTASPSLVSNTPGATFAVGVNLQSGIAIASNTPNAALNVGRLLSADVSLNSNTTDTSLTVSRWITASVAIQSSTPDALLTIAHMLTAVIAISSTTSNAILQIPIAPGAATVLWVVKAPNIKWSI